MLHIILLILKILGGILLGILALLLVLMLIVFFCSFQISSVGAVLREAGSGCEPAVAFWCAEGSGIAPGQSFFRQGILFVAEAF